MTQKKISVILTSYNYGNCIKDAINSVLCQTYDNFELIIIDDGSTDNSVEIIKSFAIKDDRIKFIQNEKNIGLSKTLQKAISYAKGEWIVFLESDDILVSNAFQKKLEISEKYPDVGFIYNNVEFFGDNVQKVEKKFKKLISQNKKYIMPKNMFYDFGYSNPVLTMSSVMVKSKYIKNIDFNSPIDKLIDWYLYIQIANRTKFLYIDEILTKFRQHDNSYIQSNGRIKFKFANISAYLKVYEQNLLNFKLLLFIIISTVRMCIKRAFVRLGMV